MHLFRGKKAQSLLEIIRQRRMPHRRQGSLTGQALLELAIFGAILIMLLGVLINYGLKYSSQQNIAQLAFRRALKSAAESNSPNKPTSVTQVLVRDKHIPSPSDPFGIGSVVPIAASASVMRNYKMQETADNIEELPRIALDIKGSKCPGSRLSPAGSDPPCYYLIAGFRQEQNIHPDSVKRYNEIYSPLNVKDIGDGDVLDETVDPNTGEVTYTYYRNLEIIDSCAGEVIDYGTAVRQCRQIVDVEVCKKECERGKPSGSDTDCNEICDQTMNVPWYCANYTETDTTTHKYTFSVLNQLFNFAIAYNKPKTMGIQQDYSQTLTRDASIHKTESSSGIRATDTWNWQVQTKRNIVYKPYEDTSGNISQPEVTSNVSQNKTYDWPEAEW